MALASDTSPAILAFDAAETERRLSELGDILLDAVAHGASVNFMADLGRDAAVDFWRGQLAGLDDCSKQLLVCELGGRLVGTVMLMFAHQPNAPHRAEIGKMLVLSSARRRGIGRRLLTAAEGSALRAGRTLVLLDTESGSAGDLLYRRCGWLPVGGIPDHSFTPDGRLAESTLFYKILGPHRRPGNMDRRADKPQAAPMRSNVVSGGIVMTKQPHTETNVEHVDGQQNTGNHKRPASEEAHGADKFGGTRAGQENVEPAQPSGN